MYKYSKPLDEELYDVLQTCISLSGGSRARIRGNGEKMHSRLIRISVRL
jgi:hypothetical protein